MAKSSMDNVKTVNSVVRTGLMLCFLAIFGVAGWFGYNKFIRPAQEAEKVKRDLAELQVKFAAQGKELSRTKTALKLVKVDHRKAYIKVLDKGVDQESNEPWFVVEFVEVDPEGNPISESREFRLRGSLIFVDSWVVKFEDKYIEEADELRNASLCVFKSIYGDLDERSGGYALDTNDGTVNTAYGTLDPKSEFEQRIWEEFWTLANDPTAQKELGIRGNHGQVNYTKVEPGMVYEVDLRASDGLTLKPAKTLNTFIPTTNRPSG